MVWGDGSGGGGGGVVWGDGAEGERVDKWLEVGFEDGVGI